MNGEEKSEIIRQALVKAWGGPIHIDNTEFVARNLSYLYQRAPAISGDQRDSLRGHERRFVDETAYRVMLAIDEAIDLATRQAKDME